MLMVPTNTADGADAEELMLFLQTKLQGPQRTTQGKEKNQELLNELLNS